MEYVTFMDNLAELPLGKEGNLHIKSLEPGRYNFNPVDQYVAFGEKHDMFIVGHTLVWFHQTPDWVFQDESGKPLSGERLLERMKEHIFTVMGRYKGRIHGWDVVNEAIASDGQFRKNKWHEIIGEDYVLKAFEYACQADPNAQIYYNEYNMWKQPQYEGVIRLIQDLQSKNVQIDGVGIQGHWGLDYPELEEIETFIQALAKLGVPLMITEMDVGVLPYYPIDSKIVDISSFDLETQKKFNPYPDVLPDPVQKDLALRIIYIKAATIWEISISAIIVILLLFVIFWIVKRERQILY